MINYKDLMIGNWVYLSKQSQYPMQVVGIGKDYCYLNFEGNEGDVFDGVDKEMMPIEITKDILLNNGFETSDYPNENGYACYEIEAKDYNVSICKSNGKWFCEIANNRCSGVGNFYFTYIHELQNGIRLITGQDLEVKEV